MPNLFILRIYFNIRNMENITILHTKISKPIKHILHISDIHIRQGDIERSRYNEYKIVFNNFIHDIKNLCRN
mgnify:CR=1 FL=1